MNNIRQERVKTGFSDRLKKCAEEQKLYDAVALAKALDENKDLESILLIGKRSDSQSLTTEDGKPVIYKHSKKEITTGSRRYLSILRQVQKHWKTEDVFKVSHMYLLAYSTQFKCSIDYLYGLTAVPTANLEDRAICEKTGLSERAVANLKGYKISGCSRTWSKVLESYLLDNIAFQWEYADAHYAHLKKLTAEYNQIQEQMKYNISTGTGNNEELDSEGIRIGTEAHSTELAYNGILFKITRDFADFIEEDIKKQHK